MIQLYGKGGSAVKHRPTIGIVTAYASGYAESEIIKGAAEVLLSRGCTAIIISNLLNFSDSTDVTGEQQIYDLVRAEALDALLILTESFSDEKQKQQLAQTVKNLNLPVIAAGAELAGFPPERCFYLNTDDAADMESLTAHLIAAHGFRSIDLLTGYPDSEPSQRRREGYLRALGAYGIPAEPQRIHYGDFWFDSGIALAERYIRGELPMPEAVVCASCYMAYGMLRTFAAAGIRVPEQITVVSYDYSEERILYRPLLTCYRRARRELGRSAAEAALCMIAGEKPQISEPPRGEIIHGRSCPCTCGLPEYDSELLAAQKRHDREFLTIFNGMELALADSRRLEDYCSILGRDQWMLTDAAALWLCLRTNWYDLSAEPEQTVSCRCITPWLDNTPFTAGADDLSWLPDMSAAFYCLPLFLKRHYMGYAVLQYNAPLCYDDFLRYWLKTASLALENLRMKSDLHYLLHCQNMSDHTDSMTGLYSEKGIRQLYGSFTETGERDCFMTVMQTGLFERTAEPMRQEQRIGIIRRTTDDLRTLCRDAAIMARTDSGAFVFLFSGGDAEQICGAITAALLQSTDYITEYGVDSFVCAYARCDGRSYDAVYADCCEQNRVQTEAIRSRRDSYRYKQLSALRNAVWSAPTDTFQPFDPAQAAALDADTFRHSYKKCFGISFQKDRIHARLCKCKYLLLTTAMTTTEIAELCGYSDTKFFLHQFSKFTGTTPQRYRRIFEK
ncbi:MAG TPA: hypothetical protein DCP68_02410 [Ruminococcus sp.]|nr:hypothetical protein [Ruminococcus sp.]